MSEAFLKCQYCHLFFESRRLGTSHLKKKHPSKSRSKKDLSKGCKSISFPNAEINLRRLTDQELLQLTKSNNKPSNKAGKTRKSIHTVRKTAEGVEIKLDNLKASEIETLINDLFTNHEEDKNLVHARKNRKRATAAAAEKTFRKFEADDDAQDSEQERHPPATTKRRTKKAKQDDDYIFPTYLEKDEDHDLEHEEIKKKPSSEGRQRGWKRVDIICEICNMKFPHQKNLDIHKLTHERMLNDPTKKFSCPLCYNRFAKKTSLQRHFIVHLEVNPFQCKFSECDARFTSWEHLKRHVSLHSARKLYPCPYCSRDYSRQEVVDRHVAKFHLSTNPSRRPPKKLRKIRKSCLMVKPVTDLAPEKYCKQNNDNNQQHHEKASQVKEETEEIRLEVGSVHFDENPQKIKTTSCSSATASDDNDNEEDEIDETPQHEEVEPKKKSLRSIIEPDPVYQRLLKENPEAAALILPATQGYQGRNQEFRCKEPECDWVGGRAYFLKIHMEKYHKDSTTFTKENSNENELSFLCGTCAFHCSSLTELTSHIQSSHESESSSAPCSFCHIPFATEAKRIMHEKIAHLSEKKFTCTKCPAKYSNRESLKSHERKKHNPEYIKKMANKCKHCEHYAKDSLALKSHILTHKVKFLVTCKLCNQTCATKQSLRRHIRYVHLNHQNPYNKSSKAKLAEAKTNPISQNQDHNQGEEDSGLILGL